MKTYLVWNQSKTECVGFTDYNDAYFTAHGRWPKGKYSPFEPTIGLDFREYYAEGIRVLPMTEIEINV